MAHLLKAFVMNTDGQTVTMTARRRNSVHYCRFLAQIEQTYSEDTLYLIVDNLLSHTSAKTWLWLEDHPRIHQVFIPKGACWLNLQEGWWRLFRREALAGQSFADFGEITQVTQLATQQINHRSNLGSEGGPKSLLATPGMFLLTLFKEHCSRLEIHHP